MPPDIERIMGGVIPYLAVEGADRAVGFYARAFAAELFGEVTRAPDGRVMNAQLIVNGGSIMIADPFPEVGEHAPDPGRTPVTLQLVVRNADLWWNRAVQAGCAVNTPFEMAPWGARYGRLRDPFGHVWALAEVQAPPTGALQ
jgi:PhnB protein